MQLWQNIPFLLILLPLYSASLFMVLRGRSARAAAVCVLGASCALSAVFLGCMTAFSGSFTYMMGHFPSPWGNEIRAGGLEAALAFVFSAVMLCAVGGGWRAFRRDIRQDLQNLYLVMCLLAQSALMAEIFTNDVFTGYVFLEILTVSACALISAKNNGRALTAATRYMVLNLIGSGLFLLSLSLLYGLTGHLLMPPIREAVEALDRSGAYHQPLTVVIALVTISLGIKSAMFPFHTWVPDAYSFSTPASGAILSSLISKGYILLLLKFYFRVFSLDVLLKTGIADVLFVFGAAGAVIGSAVAIRQLEISRMIAWSSVAQIGYIYMAMGLGTREGMLAAVFQMIAHTVAKALLFVSSGALCDASEGHHSFPGLRGAFYRCPAGGIGFTVGALSLLGVPLTGGMIVKIAYAGAAVNRGGMRMLILLAVLVISTAFSSVYLGRTLITLYRRSEEASPAAAAPGACRPGAALTAACLALSVLTLALGMASRPVLELLREGLSAFG